MLDSDYEKVYTISDYWDQPRSGAADFKGQPHSYECVFDEAEDDWSKVFILKPLDVETLKLAMEESGQDATAILANRSKSHLPPYIEAEGVFAVIEPGISPETLTDPRRWKVKWRVINDNRI